MDVFEAIENQEAAKEIDHTRALAFVISKVDDSFGDYLRLSESKTEFDDRWALMERDVISAIKDDIALSTSNMRKIKGALKPNFNQNKVAFQKNTWLFSPDLRVYTFEGESAEFICPTCSSTKTAMGLSRCECGTLWNSWSVVEGGKKRYLCREIEDRDTILASAPQKAPQDDPEEPEGDLWEEGESLPRKGSVLKVTAEEKDFIEGWNSFPNPRPKMSENFKAGFEARMIQEEGL